MKTFIFLSVMCITSLQTAFCQMSALKGSGKVVTKTFDFKNFDAVELKDLDGKIEVEAGRAYGITIAIDDNLEPLLLINEKNSILTIELNKNKNNRRYVENSNIKILITVLQLSKVLQTGNSNTFIKNVENKKFLIKSRGNGNITVEGNAENVDIQRSGNGNVYAGKFIVNNATIVSTGNGDVKVNSSESFTANGSGNGDIKNIGKAKASANSIKIGNGKIINNQ